MLYFEGMRPGNEPLPVNEWSVDEPLCRSGTRLNGKVGGQSKSNNNGNAKIKMQVFIFGCQRLFHVRCTMRRIRVAWIELGLESVSGTVRAAGIGSNLGTA